MLERLARWTYAHRWRTLIIWVIALIGVNALASSFGGDYSNSFSLPGAESQKAYDILKERFPARSGDTAQIVFKADAGVNDPAVRSTMEGLFATLAQLPHVDGITSPYSPAGAQQISPTDDTIAFADVQFDVQAGDMPVAQVKHFEEVGNRVERPGLTVEFGGPVIAQAEFQQPGATELIGIGAALIILLVTFGSLLAAGLPILTALFGIGIGLALLLLFNNILNVPEFTTQVASMIGIGVGIDYALFIVTRYRQGLSQRLDPEAAVVKALTTAGRAVIFAGTVVVISLLGILLMGFGFVQGIAIGGAATVFITMLAAVTLLPAILGFVGKNIDKLHIPRLRKVESHRDGFWYRWSRFVQRRPWVAGLAGLAAVVVLALPLFSMRLGAADAGNDPLSLTTRRAYDLLSAGFGPGFNGPLLLTAELGGPQDLQALQSLDQALAGMSGVAAVSPVIPNPKGDAAIIQLYPSSAPQDPETSDLVHELRDRVIPRTMQGTKVPVLVGGLTAVFVDFSAKIAQRLPVLIGAVIALSFLLLMVVFRSIVVPIKAALMNLLSIGAAYGVMVAVFQWGWLGGLFGVDKKGPIEAWVPMMMFTILFGLSMDYEIFLLSRIREEYLRTHNNAESVADGVANTGRVITAAAAIMIAVFLSFVLGFDVRQVKEIGLGLAVAVLIDATLVRMVLVPATMELLGDVNWWLPRWLDTAIPKVSVDREAELIVKAEYERALAEDSQQKVSE